MSRDTSISKRAREHSVSKTSAKRAGRQKSLFNDYYGSPNKVRQSQEGFNSPSPNKTGNAKLDQATNTLKLVLFKARN